MPEFTRLPTFITPTNYNLHLQPNFSTFINQGTVEINLEIDLTQIPSQNSDTAPNYTLRINTLDIQIQAVEFNHQDINLSQVSFDVENEECHIQLKRSLLQAESVLKITFSNEINNNMKGFYRSKYIDYDGSVQYIATTHFEPTGARMAFPCFDEPNFRSHFNIQITAPKDLTCLSSMDVKSKTESIESGSITWTFKDPPHLT